MNNVESVCNALDFKLGQSWEMYVSELPKMPWTSVFLTSLEVDGFDGDLQSRVLRAIHDGSNGLKSERQRPTGRNRMPSTSSEKRRTTNGNLLCN